MRTHLRKIPKGLGKEDTSRVVDRRKMTIKTMEAMKVLDMTGWEGSSNNGGGKRKGSKVDDFDEIDGMNRFYGHD